jgi:hypothetical protein
VKALAMDPVKPLLDAGHPALTWSVRRDLLGELLDPRPLWDLARVQHASKTQNARGSWTYHGGSRTIRSQADYDVLATYSELLVLVSMYRVDRRLPMVQRAAEYLFACQTPAGDIRRIYGTQYSPNYTADILRLLVEIGHESDPRVMRGLDWLRSMRQDDGGWAVPARTAWTRPLILATKLPRPIEPDRRKPSSHLITGIVLRAFAAHPEVRHAPEAREAALLLARRFFRPDTYPDRREAGYWTKLAFPFRWTDVVSSLDAIARIGIPADQPDVARGLRWIRDHQLPSGLWSTGYPNSPDPLADHWVSFAAARVVRRFSAIDPFAHTGKPLESAHAER